MPFPLLVGKGRLMVFAGFADAIFPGCVHQQAPRHHHQQRPDRFGFFEVERRGEKLRVLQQSAPAFRLLLGLGTHATPRALCELGIVQFMKKTTGEMGGMATGRMAMEDIVRETPAR